MTRDEVMAMTDGELRGWAWTLAYCGNKTRNMVSEKGHAVIDGATIIVPDYPNDIAAAWELMEEIVKNGGQPLIAGGRGGWDVSWDDMSDGNGAVDCCISLAITRAFIMSMECTDD